MATKRENKKLTAAELKIREAALKTANDKLGNTPKPPSNSAVVHGVMVAKGVKVLAQWERADKNQGSADAAAALLLVEAVDCCFFTEISIPSWHKIATAKQRTAFANEVLAGLFGVEKATSAQRQRLQRIKYVVPALCKAGGLAKAELSKSGLLIMLETETAYFKSCAAGVEATGKYGLSIAKLAKGAVKYLGKEIARTPRAATTSTGDTPTVVTGKLSEVAQIVTGKVSVLADGAAQLDASTNKALQQLLVKLLGLYALDKSDALDLEQVTAIYKTA